MCSEQIHLHPRSPVSPLSPHNFTRRFFFFKSKAHQIHLLLPVCTWVWDHLLEYGWRLRARIPEENGLLPLAGMITPHRGVGLLSPPSIWPVLSSWLAWSCAGPTHAVRANTSFTCYLQMATTSGLYSFSAHPFWGGYWTSERWYRCPT